MPWRIRPYVLGLLVLAVPAAAQRETAITPGMRVRVLSPAVPSGLVVGTVAVSSADTLYLVAADSPYRALALALDDVESLELSVAQHDVGTRVVGGMVAGGMLGVLMGAFVSMISFDEPLGDNPPPPKESEESRILKMSAVFAAAGALRGLMADKDEWRTLRSRRARVSFTPSPRDGGARLGIALSF